MIGKSYFSSYSLRDSLIFDNSMTTPAKNILIIPCGLQNGSPLKQTNKQKKNLLFKILNITVPSQFESYCPSFFLDLGELTLSAQSGVTWHDKGFFFLLIHKFIFMKGEYLKLRLAPPIWDPNQPIHSL